MNISHKIGAVALTAAVAVGGTTAAFAAGDSGSGSTGKAAKVAFLCEHQDEIVPHLTTRQANLTERIAKLTAAETKATDAGRTKAAERIAGRIATLQGKLDTVTSRLAKAPTWIAEHCTTTTPTSTTTG